jgi:hypothetical protein
MVKRTEALYAGYHCLKLENQALAVWVTLSLGPRIIGLALHGGADLLAKLPDDTLSCPGGGFYSFRGGHRLWVAPEDPARTYLPDDEPVTVTDALDGILVTQPVEAQTGIQKSLHVQLPGSDALVIVDHIVYNLGSRPIELAPWAITQFAVGGLAVLPQATAPADEHGVLPNRHIVLWAYTSIGSPQIRWGDRYVFVEAAVKDGALKVGFPNPAGWLGYLLEDTLFVKHAPFRQEAVYFDRGSSSQCYCNSRFLELETLGPRTELAPGESVIHRETWAVYGGVQFHADEAAVGRIDAQLGLTQGGQRS